MRNPKTWFKFPALRERLWRVKVTLYLVLACLLPQYGCGTGPSGSGSPPVMADGELMTSCRPPVRLASGEVNEAIRNVEENAVRANECRSRVDGWQQWARDHGFAP